VVVKSGNNSAIAIIAYGSVLTEALAAAKMLEDDGISVDVINGRFAAPVDEEIVLLTGQGKGIITVEDHRLACGFGSGLLELAASIFPGGIKRPIVTLGAPRRFIKQGSRKTQLRQAGINADRIVQTAKEMLKRNV